MKGEGSTSSIRGIQSSAAIAIAALFLFALSILPIIVSAGGDGSITNFTTTLPNTSLGSNPLSDGAVFSFVHVSGGSFPSCGWYFDVYNTGAPDGATLCVAWGQFGGEWIAYPNLGNIQTSMYRGTPTADGATFMDGPRFTPNAGGMEFFPISSSTVLPNGPYFVSAVTRNDTACDTYWTTGVGSCGHNLTYSFTVESATTTPVCTENCNSNVLFLPGIEASRLYDANNNEVWIPTNDVVADTLAMTTSGVSINPDITTFDVIGETHAPQLYHNIYKSFLNEMDTWQTTYGITATTTPYDWRLDYDTLLTNGKKLSNGHISYLQTPDDGHDPYLIETLKQLAATSKTGKVTIIAHSNGGLLAKALMIKLGTTTTAQLIDKVIFVAVPNLGTPQAVAGLLHGYESGIPFAISDMKFRYLAQNIPVSYELLPSSNYFTYATTTSVSTSVISFSSSPFFNWAQVYGNNINSTVMLRAFMAGSSRIVANYADLNTPQVVNPDLFDAAVMDHQQLDNWTPPASVQVIAIAGWGNETLGNITYEPAFDCIVDINGTCNTYVIAPDRMAMTPHVVIDGDGTVVEPSALYTNNVPMTRYWMDLLSYNCQNPFTTPLSSSACLPEAGPVSVFRATHSNILGVPQLETLLSNLIANNPAPLPQFISVTPPQYSGDKPRLHFILHSPLTLGFKDQQGNYTGATATTTVFDIPGVQYERFGEVQWLSVPKNLAGQVIMRGTGNGSFTFDIQEVNGNVTIATTTFAAVPSATSTVATITIDPARSPTASSTLAVDYNGDGVIDTTLNAKQGSIVLPATYRWDGFSQPINDTAFHPDQSTSVFKAGSTIPVKFQLKNASGTPLQASTTPIWLTPQKGSAMAAPVDESVYSDPATSGTAFRYDAASQQYIYNWSTKGLSAGYWYRIFVKLDDGTIRSVMVGLK